MKNVIAIVALASLAIVSAYPIYSPAMGLQRYVGLGEYCSTAGPMRRTCDPSAQLVCSNSVCSPYLPPPPAPFVGNPVNSFFPSPGTEPHTSSGTQMRHEHLFGGPGPTEAQLPGAPGSAAFVGQRCVLSGPGPRCGDGLLCHNGSCQRVATAPPLPRPFP